MASRGQKTLPYAVDDSGDVGRWPATCRGADKNSDDFRVSIIGRGWEGRELNGNPVTTNPLIIMLINMTIVFAVLIGLSFMIRLIHLVDPTKEK